MRPPRPPGVARSLARVTGRVRQVEHRYRESSGSSGGGTNPIDLRNPTNNAYYLAAAAKATSPNWTLGQWRMVKDVESHIYGAVRAPDSFTSLAVRLMVSAAGETEEGDVRLQVRTAAVGDGDTIDGGLTAETAQTVSLTNAAAGVMKFVVFPTSGGLGSSPAAGELIVVDVFHDGDDAADTLAADLVLWGAWLEAS